MAGFYHANFGLPGPFRCRVRSRYATDGRTDRHWPSFHGGRGTITYRHIICHEEQQSILPDGLEFKEDIIFVCCVTDLTVAGIASSIKLVNARLNRLSYRPANTTLSFQLQLQRPWTGNITVSFSTFLHFTACLYQSLKSNIILSEPVVYWVAKKLE